MRSSIAPDPFHARQPLRDTDRPVGEESAQLLKLLHARTNGGTWKWHVTSCDTFFPRRLKTILGYEPSDLASDAGAFMRLVHLDDRSAVAATLEQFLEGALEIWEPEARMLGASGEVRWISFRATASRDPDGRALRVVGVYTDVTAQKRSEQERDRFFNLSADMLAIVTGTGVFERANDSWARTIGWSASELEGAHITSLLDIDQAMRVLEAFRTLADGSDLLTFELRVSGRDGAPRWLEWSVSASDRGVFYCAARDITDRKALEDALRFARDEALESARLKAQFLANMSHEIRTPMNGVIGMTQVLADTELSVDQRRCVDTVTTSAEALLGIIDDILDFSKLDAGKVKLEKLEIDVTSAAEDVLEMLAPRAEAKGVSLTLHVDSQTPEIVLGDPTRVRQVLVNLVSNAVKFTPEGGQVSAHISATSQASGASDVLLRFEVRDTGIGIPASARGRLFRMFEQADGSTTRRHGGTGLGLAICKQLVELMGGEIQVESEEARGSTFWFTLPVERVTRPLTTRAPDAPLVGRAMYVSSDPASRSAVSRQIHATGLEVTLVDGAAQALDLATASAFDLVVIDMRIDGVDGVELGTKIRGDLRHSAVPMILLTAWTERGHERRAERAGFCLTTTKPTRARHLAGAVRRQLGRPNGKRTPAKGIPACAPHTSAPLSRGAVLLAEDNAINREVARRMLEKLGCQVDIANDGAEAVAMVANGSYALVLMDCQMPNLDGYDATHAIRGAEGAEARTPIIAMTANALTGDREKCISAGMDDYVTKPITKKVLAQVIDRWLPRA